MTLSSIDASAVVTSQQRVEQPLRQTFERMKQDFESSAFPDCERRIRDLKTIKTMILENRQALTQAINDDYGNRCWHETTFGEFIGVVNAINYMVRHLKRWMRPQKRKVDLAMFPGAKNRVIPQPLGVVGIIVPWNGPLNLSLIPAATAIAAGNRVMIKMSENSGHTGRLLKALVQQYFPESQLAVFEETGGVGKEFSTLPFDLLFFTGSVETGKAVMAAAARNLTPVILELGGKSPAVIDPAYSLQKAARRIIFAKQFNAGQVCLNVDYVFVHEDQRDAFVALLKQEAARMVPDINSPGYTCIIDDRAMNRLVAALDDARAKDAIVINLTGQALAKAERKLPLHVVLNPTEDMEIAQRETFGPILVVRTYRSKEEVIRYIRARPRPLALYVFSDNPRLVDDYLSATMSGGVSVNDTMLHAFQDDMIFGGVGASGMGHYHGYEGFAAFSKMRPVFYQASHSPMALLLPPYPGWITKSFEMMLKLKR